MIRTVKLDARDYSLSGKYAAGDRVLVLCDAADAAFTVTLPDAGSVDSVVFKFVKSDSGSNVVTIGTVDSQTISGSSTTTIRTQYGAVVVDSDGTNWYKDVDTLL